LWECAANTDATVAGGLCYCSGCGQGTNDHTHCRSYGDLYPYAHTNLAANAHADTIADEYAYADPEPDLDTEPDPRTEHPARDGPASSDQRGL
jgi:hypothetical protein